MRASASRCEKGHGGDWNPPSSVAPPRFAGFSSWSRRASVDVGDRPVAHFLLSEIAGDDDQQVIDGRQQVLCPAGNGERPRHQHVIRNGIDDRGCRKFTDRSGSFECMKFGSGDQPVPVGLDATDLSEEAGTLSAPAATIRLSTPPIRLSTTHHYQRGRCRKDSRAR